MRAELLTKTAFEVFQVAGKCFLKFRNLLICARVRDRGGGARRSAEADDLFGSLENEMCGVSVFGISVRVDETEPFE